MAFLKADLRDLAGIKVDPRAPYAVQLRLRAARARPESYRLHIDGRGAEIVAADLPGLYYGVQTLLQILVLGQPERLPAVDIDDWPEYKLRSFLVDSGRSVFTLPLLKRAVRILARLKMNVLHLHAIDDQLGGLKFKRLPLGSENPSALPLSQLKELIRYARQRHVTVMPEVECWGHAGSMIYHFPNLYGAPGMWNGMSFGIGEDTFRLFEKVFDELVPVLEKDCLLHVGLDEANWALLKTVPEQDKDKYSPTDLVRRLYHIVQAAGRKHKRRVKMHLWADHGGRPLPEELKRKLVVEPWRYCERDKDDILAKLKHYGGAGKPRFMMGAGMSSAHFRGHFGATRIWCQNGRQYPNVEGVTICQWNSNDLAGQLLGLFGGADYAWSPDTPVKQSTKSDDVGEILDGEVGIRMRRWQARFKDADPEAIDKDRGPEVVEGFYCWGDKAGQPVAPTALMRVPGQDDKPAYAGAEM